MLLKTYETDKSKVVPFSADIRNSVLPGFNDEETSNRLMLKSPTGGGVIAPQPGVNMASPVAAVSDQARITEETDISA